MQEPARVFKIAFSRHSEQAVPQTTDMSGCVSRAAHNRQALRHEAAVCGAAGPTGGHSFVVLETLLRGTSEGGADPERSLCMEGGVYTWRTTWLDSEQYLQEEFEDRTAGWR